MNLLTQLNDAQKEAATYINGSLLVIAGAGSGKTRVITSRIAYLLDHCNVPASQIVALTFTNKAALEMKERITALLGAEQQLPFVGTFHAYCLKLLKHYAKINNISFAGILDTEDQQKLIKSIVQKYGLEKQLNITAILRAISHIKNHTLEPSKHIHDYANALTAEIYHAYEQEKKLNHCFDFDDLLLETVKLFKHKTFTSQFNAQVRHILIDEYQDTNVTQHLLLKNMCLAENKLCVDSICAVGDEDQSIYSWRGATVTNMKNFLHDFSGTDAVKVVKIEQNYRSAQQILDIANTVIMHNTERTPKKLWSEKRGINRSCVLTFTSEYQEAESLAQLASLLTGHNKADGCAFLYRTHTQSRVLEEALVKHSIPYRIIGGTQFYERMEIKDLLAYLKLLTNPYDRISCARALNTPNRGLGAKAEELLFETWNSQPHKPLLEIITILIQTNNGIRADAFTQFAEIFVDLHSASMPLYALKRIIQKTGYLTYLKNMHEQKEATERCSNVDELINAAMHAESIGIQTVSEFLESIALMQDTLTQSKEKSGCIFLMTLHAAKGLEFDTVVLSGLEEGILPTFRATHDPASLEEERRLLYVGITRARERLLFTRTRTRLTYGKLTDQLASRFVKELPEQLVPHQDASLWRTQTTRSFLSQWLGLNTIHPVITSQQTVITPSIHQKPSPWRLRQPVKHATFGVGVIQSIEQNGSQTIIAAQFRSGVKKIVSNFLVPL